MILQELSIKLIIIVRVNAVICDNLCQMRSLVIGVGSKG